jgi:hypothetical protein
MFRYGYLGPSAYTFEKLGKFVFGLKGTYGCISSFHYKQAR